MIINQIQYFEIKTRRIYIYIYIIIIIIYIYIYIYIYILYCNFKLTFNDSAVHKNK